MKPACTKEEFLNTITEHVMTVHLDVGVVRTILFQKPGTINRQFALTTWPGHLCISGDMGTYVFRRLADMFEFFRADTIADKEGPCINLSYWAEKLVAVDKNSRAKEYSYDTFKQVIQERVDEAETTKPQRDAVADLLERLIDADMDTVHREVADFEEFEFYDFWEHDLTEYTYHFIWCCYAIAWGIEHYDKSRADVKGEI